MGGERSGSGLLLAALLHLLCLSALGLKMPLLKKQIRPSSDFYFRLVDVYATKQPEELKRNNISFAASRPAPANNLTLDDKCRLGLPVTLRWTNYGPYASLVRPKSPAKAGGVGLVGIFPHVIARALSTCCHRDTSVHVGEYIETLKGLEKRLSIKDPYDMMFPVGLQSMGMMMFKDLPVVSLLRAPRTTLVVPEASEDSGRTYELFRTVGMAWPILAFIFFAAVVSGAFMWVLDRDEFPPNFISGLWEGFWWAVVTMTTVGYGDRAPRSILGRLFCVIWIVIGMSIIAIFTALITASLSASIQYRFVVHGSVMGSVDGSQEERIGTGMNADIKTFKTPKDVVEALVDTNALEVAIIDNYLLSYFHKVIKQEPVRVYANLEQPINYGLVMAPNSSKFVKCFRRFVRNNPQDIFDIIRSNLNPLKNPTDDISEELKASQGFLGEKAFRMILYCLAGSLGVFFLLGAIWEFALSKIKCGWNRQVGKGSGTTKVEMEEDDADPKPRRSIMQSLIGFRLAHRSRSATEELQNLQTIKSRTTRIRQLVREYEEFYEEWLEKLKETTDEDELKGFADKVPEEKPSFLMIAYNGSRE